MSLGLPVIIDNDFQYKGKLNECFQAYNKWVDNFISKDLYITLCRSKRTDLQPDWCAEKAELTSIEDDILSAIDNYYAGQIFEAQSKVYGIISELVGSDELGFLVSDIDRSYSTRLVAPFPDLYHPIIDNSEEYVRMNTIPLSFFRGRTGYVENHNDMLHIPLDRRDLVATQRFSVPG